MNLFTTYAITLSDCQAVTWLTRLPANLSPRRAEFDSRRDSWWTKWHWDRFFSQYFGFPLSVSFHHSSINIHSASQA